MALIAHISIKAGDMYTLYKTYVCIAGSIRELRHTTDR